MKKIIIIVLVLSCSVNFESFSQVNEFNRPQITLLIETAKALSQEAEQFSTFISAPKINSSFINIMGTHYASIPSDWYINRDFFRYKDEYEEDRYTKIPYFNKVDYNSISSQLYLKSLDDAAQQPSDFLTEYASEVFDYIFKKTNNKFSLDRIEKRSLYNAKDALIRLAENVQRGDAIIKDDLEKIFQNIFLIGLKINSFKVDKNQTRSIKCDVYLFKLDFSRVINSPEFWKNCFDSSTESICYNKRDFKIEFLKKKAVSAIWTESSNANMTAHSGFYQIIEAVFKAFN